MKRVTWVAIAILTVSCAHKAVQLVKPSGFVLVREYVDSIKSETGDQYQKVQYGWDYDLGSAKIRTYSMEGKLLSDEAAPDLTLNTSDSELAYAFALVRSHPNLKAASARPDATLYGGFSYRYGDDKSPAAALCRAKSRCVHVFISGGISGETLYAQAIVDLASGKVVDPNFTAANKTPFSK